MITHIKDFRDFHLTIGEYSDIKYNPKIVKDEGFYYILNVCGKSLRSVFSRLWKEGVYVKYEESPITIDPIEDFDTFIMECEDAYYKVSSVRFANPTDKILIFCIAGMDRSPFIAARLLKKEVSSWSEAYSIIKKCRPWIIEHYEWIPEYWK